MVLEDEDMSNLTVYRVTVKFVPKILLSLDRQLLCQYEILEVFSPPILDRDPPVLMETIYLHSADHFLFIDGIYRNDYMIPKWYFYSQGQFCASHI